MYEDSEVELEFGFTDVTVCESEGYFETMNDMMMSEFPHPKTWMVKTELTIDSRYGIAAMSLHLFYNAKVYIMAYRPSIGDVYYNPDVTSLSVWAQERGWGVPYVSDLLVEDNIEFWKHYWETLLVKSEFLEKMFGTLEHGGEDES